MTEQTDDVPEFILEKLRGYDTSQLRAITENLRDSATPSSELPADFRAMLEEQNETTVEAVGATAHRLADGDGPGLTGYEGMAQDIIDHAREELGDEIAVSVAQDLETISVDEAGAVWELSGEGQIAVEELADRYIDLAGAWITNAFSDIADEYAVESPVNLSNNPFS